MKREIDRLDICKLETTSNDLIKLSNVVKNEVVKKDVYNVKIKDIEDKIPSIINLATNAVLNAKINEEKREIPDIINLATNDGLSVF